MNLAVTAVLSFSCLGGTLSLPQEAVGCPLICPAIVREVCGTNGKTFSNTCELRAEACRQRTHISVRRLGPCNEDDKAQETENKGALPGFPPGGVNREEYFAAASRCRIGCNRILKPVCGSDDKTYDNECLLEQTGCIRNLDLTIKSEGYCESEEILPEDYERCEHFRCPKIREPVCGTNGRTYANKCELLLHACLKIIIGLEVQHPGSCEDGPPPVQTEDFRKPVVVVDPDRKATIFLFKREAHDDGLHLFHRGQSRQSCPTECSLIYRPVCGTDGETYSSECQLQLTRCQSKPRLQLSQRGKCPGAAEEDGNNEDFPLSSVVAEDDCPAFCTLEYDPVCGGDGNTYSNMCNLKVAGCVDNKSIGVRHRGPCNQQQFQVEEIVAETTGVTCDTTFTPVCGTDNVTYSNICNLRGTANHLQLNIQFQHEGRCRPA